MPRKIIIDRISASESLPDQEKNSKNISDYLKQRFPDQLNFSIKQTAKILNISEDFIRDRIVTGTIQANKFGRHFQLNVLELTKLLEEGIE
jgi:excisionase family DNA binding protein